MPLDLFSSSALPTTNTDTVTLPAGQLSLPDQSTPVIDSVPLPSGELSLPDVLTPDTVSVAMPPMEPSRVVMPDPKIVSVPLTSSEITDTAIIAPSPILKNWASFYGVDNMLHPNEFNIRPIETQTTSNWVFWLMILCLGGFSYARMFFPYRSRQYFKAIFGIRNFNQFEREGGYFDEPPAWVFFGNFVLIFSLLVVQTFSQTDLIVVREDISDLALFGVITSMVLLFFLLKFLATSFIAWVFQTRGATSAYTRNIYLFNNCSGVVLLPVVIYNAYNPTMAALYVGWLFIIVINVFKVYRGAVLGNTRSGYSPYYLFLYLCTVELIPLLLIAKVAGLDFV
ncbi:MAG TPA: DUF4271 domain-containing protein [Bacteroidales bacterium]|nr:DUF4271 domain-containing protein [Bacteroidales bacterium]